MATNKGYSSVLSLTKQLFLLATIPNKDSTTKEEVGTGDGSASTFWLDYVGVIEGTYTLYYGASEAAATNTLTETTHYTIDLDTSKITLTAAGISLLSNSKLFAAYSYNRLEMLNSELLKQLNAAEDMVTRITQNTFADSTDSNPAYRKITNELIKGHYNPLQKVYELQYNPVVKIQTTVNGAYTTGSASITLTDASLLPTTGTIYIGGNKVTYTSKSSNVLTIPTSTPSISNGATVRGEVIELSVESEGNSPSYTVLDPDTEYEIDYVQGLIKVLTSAYSGEISSNDRIYPSNYLIKVAYMHAWYEDNENPTIPTEIEWCVNALAARKLMGSIVAKAHTAGLNDFNPSLINVDKNAIDEVLFSYQPLHVGMSMYNKQHLS